MILLAKKNKLQEIKETSFNTEKEMQFLCEKNINVLLNLELLTTEYNLANYRFDTLAYNKDDNSFVIIEYKNKANYSVIDQGIAYLNTLLDNKAEVVLTYNKKHKANKSKDSFSWELTQVFFIAPEFSKYQKDSLNKNLPIKLFEISKHKDIINFKNVESQFNNSINNKNDFLVNRIGRIKNEIKVYDEEKIFSIIKNGTIKDVYVELDEYILSLGNISAEMKKLYKVYKKENRNIFSIEPKAGALYLFFNEKYQIVRRIDSRKIGQNVTGKGHHASGDYRIKIIDDRSIGYIKDIIKKYYESK